MRSLFLVAVLSAVAWARPETYKETEDFQYARSSSDEGRKSGFYGAQRGNMGGNYERAHNMDSLAQHQMSGAVKQVEGELGDASKTRTGSVYTAANSRGVYGSGRYDLSNLQGRNFGESVSQDSSRSSLSAFNQHAQNSDWRSHSQQSIGYGASDQYGQSSLQSGSLQAADATSGFNSHGLANSGRHYDQSSGYHFKSGYHSQSGYQGQSAYDQHNSNLLTSGSYGAGDQTQSRYRIIPVVGRIVDRPTIVAIPIVAQNHDSQRASTFDQNAINSEAEVLSNHQQHISTVPLSNAKHYESSYNYQKAWERHSDSNPTNVLAAPATTANPFPKNSELYEESQVSSGADNLQQASSHDHLHSSNAYNRHHNYAQSGSAQSRQQLEYSSQHKSQSDSNSNAYMQGTHGSLTGVSSLGADVDSQPKSYQSSYSYHKAWERQGDPYVIVPATNGGSIASNTKTGASSQHYGSQQYRQSRQHYSQGSALDCDCDENGYVRTRRSYPSGWDDLGQQSQSGWEEDLGQQSQTKWDRVEELGQQTQQSWGSFDKQIRPEKLEDLGQQTQDLWQGSDQQPVEEKLGNLENLGQQTQDLGQQTQESWQGLDQQADDQLGNLEDLGQQTQQSWGKSNKEQKVNSQKLEDFGQQQQEQLNLDNDNQRPQQSINDPDTQQTQSKLDNFESLGQQTQQIWDISHNTENQNTAGNIATLGQQTQTQWADTNDSNKTRNIDTTNTEQQTQTQFQSVNQEKFDKEQAEDNTQHITRNTASARNNENSYFSNPRHPTFWGSTDEQRHQFNVNNLNSYYNSQTHGASWQEQVNNNDVSTTSNHPLQSLWDKIDNLEEQSEHSLNEERQHHSNVFMGYENLQHSYHGQESTYHHESNSAIASSSYNRDQYQTHYSGYKPLYVANATGSTNNKSNTELDHNEGSHEKPIEHEFLDKLEPAEVGRGDIGADDEFLAPTDKTTPKTLSVPETFSTQIKPEKSPEEIEALSLSRGIDKNKNVDTSQSDALGVLSLSQQRWLEDQRLSFNTLHKLSSTSTTPSSNIHISDNNKNSRNFEQHSGSEGESQSHHNYNNHQQDIENESKHILEQTDANQHQNSEHQIEVLEKQGQDLNQQNLQQFDNLGHRSHQQNTGQGLEDFGQQHQDLNQQNLQQFDNLEHHSHSIDQQNTGQELEDFGQQHQDLNQQNLQQFDNLEHDSHSIDQQNTGQQLEDFGQQHQDLNQQNLQQFDNLEHHGLSIDQQNTGQELEDFRQQNQDLNQHNLQQFEDLGHHSHSIDKQNTEQELEELGQQTQDFHQQNLQQVENLEHHSHQQNTGQEMEDFGQQSHDMNQQNQQQFEHLGYHRHSMDQQNNRQKLEDFGQQHQNLNQKFVNEFVPDSNTEIQEQKITAIDHPGSHSVPKDIEIPPAVSTEKPGFWKSVGSKFSSAKDSVSSWFKSS